MEAYLLRKDRFAPAPFDAYRKLESAKPGFLKRDTVKYLKAKCPPVEFLSTLPGKNIRKKSGPNVRLPN